jgi:hypothetical protein
MRTSAADLRARQTPDDGTAVHPDAAVKNPFVNEEGPGESRAPLGFFKTMIEFDRAVAHHWPTLTTGSVGIAELPKSLNQISTPRLGRIIHWGSRHIPAISRGVTG